MAFKIVVSPSTPLLNIVEKIIIQCTIGYSVCRGGHQTLPTAAPFPLHPLNHITPAPLHMASGTSLERCNEPTEGLHDCVVVCAHLLPVTYFSVCIPVWWWWLCVCVCVCVCLCVWGWVCSPYVNRFWTFFPISLKLSSLEVRHFALHACSTCSLMLDSCVTCTHALVCLYRVHRIMSYRVSSTSIQIHRIMSYRVSRTSIQIHRIMSYRVSRTSIQIHRIMSYRVSHTSIALQYVMH